MSLKLVARFTILMTCLSVGAAEWRPSVPRPVRLATEARKAGRPSAEGASARPDFNGGVLDSVGPRAYSEPNG